MAASYSTNRKEYYAWQSMKQRCYNTKHQAYANYGGRGITICDRWLSSFVAFFDDIGPSPEGASIDRINNDGNYEPGNCRWATRREQLRNRRMNRFLTIRGETKTLAGWSETTGVSASLIVYRLNHDWAVEDAIFIPAAKNEGVGSMSDGRREKIEGNLGGAIANALMFTEATKIHIEGVMFNDVARRTLEYLDLAGYVISERRYTKGPTTTTPVVVDPPAVVDK